MILEDLTTEEWMDLRYREGREDGREENSKQIARNLKSMGLSVQQIVKGTGLSTETIQSL